jgi:ribose-phosphate pyrophosphokinase
MFQVQVVIDNKPFNFKVIKFSDGASSVVAPSLPKDFERAVITIQNVSADSYSTVIQQVYDILIEKSVFAHLKVCLPYLPYARADRPFGEGYANPLKIFLRTFALLDINELELTDPHNLDAVMENAPQVDKVTVLSQAHCFKQVLNRNKPLKEFVKNYNPIILAPDEGAWDNVIDIAKEHGKDYSLCRKERNPHNGYISGLEILEGTSVKGRNVIICDDICDGGATFNIAAQKLREQGAKSIVLYVTHGIFSKGINSLEVDSVYFYQRII